MTLAGSSEHGGQSSRGTDDAVLVDGGMITGGPSPRGHARLVGRVVDALLGAGGDRDRQVKGVFVLLHANPARARQPCSPEMQRRAGKQGQTGAESVTVQPPFALDL